MKSVMDDFINNLIGALEIILSNVIIALREEIVNLREDNLALGERMDELEQ